MPGIVGIISQRSPAECRAFVRAMVASMEHESFYVSGTHFVPEMGVYGGWVAHPNSFAAGRVSTNEGKDISLLFSGECFPDSDPVANQTKDRDTNSHSNWLIRLYEKEGARFFERLNGLFSGLLIDQRKGQVFLFNDRYGVERIYWHETEDAFYFASEAKALLRILPELRAFDDEGVAQFLTYGCTVEGRTIFRGVQLLPGASLWSFQAGRCQKRHFFSPATWESQAILPEEAFHSEFQRRFKKLLPAYFESDARIGISLTGGLDTRMIMSCRPETARNVICYTFSGQTGETMDDRLAQQVAKACGLEHRLLRIKPDFFSEFSSHVDRTVFVTDGCFGVTGAHELYFNKQARNLAPTRLTGNYGSEVLRGVSTFKPVGLSPDLFESEFSQALKSSKVAGTNGNIHPVTSAAFREIPWNLFGSLAAGRSQLGFRTPYLDNEIVALAYQAPESLRVSSLPAWRLVQANSARLSGIPTDRGRSAGDTGPISRFRKLLLEAAFKLDYLNNEGCPHWLSPFDRTFTGIGSALRVVGLHKYLHYRSWFRREVADYVSSVVAEARNGRVPFWNRDFLESMAEEHIRGRKNYTLEINAVLTLEVVERLLFRGLPFGTSDLEPSVERAGRKESLLSR